MREIAPAYNMRGFEPPLETSKVEEFMRRLTELLNDQNDDTTRLKVRVNNLDASQAYLSVQAEQATGLNDFESRLRKLYDAKSKNEHSLRSDREAMVCAFPPAVSRGLDVELRDPPKVH